MTIPELRIKGNTELGINKSPFDGSVASYASLSDAEKIKLTNWMSAYIAGHPSEFTPQQVNVADGPDGQGFTIEQVEEYGFWEQAVDFTEAVGDEAVDLIVEPLSDIGKSISYLTNLVVPVALVVGYILLSKKLK